MKTTLEIQDLKVSIAETGEGILKGVSLTVNRGEIHAFMGPNGSGKSTLAAALMGNPEYEITSGKILLNGRDITGMEPDERAKEGLFLAFQYPVEIAGVPIKSFLLKSYQALHPNEKVSPRNFLETLNDKAATLGVDTALLSRNLNEGFSGGEKKKLEIMQLAVLRPKFAVLDETDSGLDVDALKLVSKAINLAKEEHKLGIVVITHYQRILKYLNPDFVHILRGGRIVKSGEKDLAEKLEKEGYKAYGQE